MSMFSDSSDELCGHLSSGGTTEVMPGSASSGVLSGWGFISSAPSKAAVTSAAASPVAAIVLQCV